MPTTNYQTISGQHGLIGQGGVGSWGNPLVDAYGGPMGLYGAQSGANVDRQRQQQQQQGWDQQQQRATSRDRMGRPITPQGGSTGSIGSVLDSMLRGSSTGTPAGATGTPAMGAAPNITTGPIWSPQHVSSATDQIRGAQATLPQQAGGADQELQAYLGDLMRSGGSRNALDFNRQATHANAQHEFSADQAAQGAGINRARADLGQYGIDTGLQTGAFSAVMNMLLSLFNGR